MFCQEARGKENGMKDKELKEILIGAGILEEKIAHFSMETYCRTNNLGEKLDAIIEFLGIEFKRDPDPKLRAYKIAPDNTNKNNPAVAGQSSPQGGGCALAPVSLDAV
jgi:hypothetical protein